MRCCLPNKLVILRKHFKYSQQDLAKKLNVSINEYMAYENGSAMCSMDQLIQLADIYGISFDEMFVNSVDIDLPDIEDSLEIPFINDLIEESSVVEEEKIMPSSLEQTREVVFDDNLNNTIVAPSVSEDLADTHQEELAKTVVTRVVREENKPNDQSSNKPSGAAKNAKAKSKNTNMIIAAGVVVAVLVGLILWFVLGRNGNGADNKVGNVNRLLATSEYVAFVDDDGKVKVTGDNSHLDIDDIVQISGSDSFVAGLKADGSVVVDNSLDVKDFKNITMIAAGADHLVGLDSEGKIVCTGNDDACDIEEIENIKRIGAMEDATFVITNSGELRAFGSAKVVDSIDGQSDVTKVSAYKDTVALLKKDGSVKVFGNAAYDTSKWVGVVDIACGNGFVVGLKNDGTMVYTGSSALGEKVESFNNVKFIAAANDYYVGCSASGKCYGDGNNSNNQFTSVSDEVALDKVSNFQYSISAKKVKLTWDSVEGAKHYIVSIDTSDKYSVKSETNSLSVDANKFESGKSYKVSIIAYGEDESESEEAVYDLHFEASTTALDSVNNISGKLEGNSVKFTWDAVNNAKSYKVSIPDLSVETSVNKPEIVFDANKFTEGNKYKISIVAVGNDNYTDSAASEYEYTFEGVKEKLATPNNISAKVDGSYVVFSWSTVANATEYNVTIDVDGLSQKVTTNSLSVDVNKFANGNTYNVTVAAVGSGKYTDSDARSFSYVHEVKPKNFTVKYVYGDEEVKKFTVEEGSTITLDVTIPNQFQVTGYMIGGSSYGANASYVVSGDTTINIEGKCPEGYEYKNVTDGCKVIDVQPSADSGE